MENKLPQMIQKSLEDRAIYTKALFTRPQSLGELLPYSEYLPEYGAFVLKDGSLGVVFAIEPVEHEPLTEKEIMRVVASTKSWFNLPESCVLQVLYESSPLSPLDESLHAIAESYPEAHPVAKLLFGKKMDQVKASCSVKVGHTPLVRRLFLSLRYFPGDLEKKLEEGTKGFAKAMASFMHTVKDFEGNSQLRLRRLDAEGLIENLRRFLNPKTFYKRKFARVNLHHPLSDQVLYSAPELDYGGISREGVMTRTISLKTSPSFAYPGGMAHFVTLDFPFRLSLNFSFPTPAAVKKFFTTKEFFLENAASAKARLQKAEIEAVQERLARDDRCLMLTFCVVIEGESTDELDEKTRRVCQVFHNDLECEVIEEKHIGLGLCLNTLPLNYTQDADYSTKRAIRILKTDAMNFIPLFDTFRGFRAPLAVHQSREGALVPFSLLENETSNHTVVLADTGSGKSALVIDWIVAAKRMNPEPIVFVIDKKSSYGMLSQYFDGDLTVFDRNQERIPFSPFRGIYNEEKIAFLTKMLMMAVRLTSPSFAVESEHQSAITQALKLAYTKKVARRGLEFRDGELVTGPDDGPVALEMNDFIVELGALVQDRSGAAKAVITALLSKLKPFYGDGIYAKFFSSGDSFAEEKQKLFYVYDLDALDGDPILQTLMTMSVIEEIRCILSLPRNQGRPGFLVMEEFAMLGRNNPAFRDFAIDFAETMRKRGCWLITLTPRPQNYFDLEVGKAFWGVADNFIFLQMGSDNVDFIAERSSMFDEANTEIIRSLRTKKGQYADVYYMNKSKTKQGAFRYRQTPFDRWMSPTNAEDALKAKKALETYANKWDALDALINEGGDHG